MMAVADLALEILYVRSVLERLGHVFADDDVEVSTKDPEAHRLIHAVGDIVHGPTEVGVDNTGAFNLCQRATVGKNSRHVERKVFKMRELQFARVVRLTLVPTDDMVADILTKPLPDATFLKHRATVFSARAAAAATATARMEAHQRAGGVNAGAVTVGALDGNGAGE